MQCLYDKQHMFQGLEINYPMLVGPIMLVPQALSTQALQRLHRKDVHRMRAWDEFQ